MNKQAANTLTIAMVQDNFLVGDIRGNADRIIHQAMAAAQKGADLAVFPELALVGYPPEDLLHRPGFIAQAEAELVRIQQAVKNIDIVLGLPLKVDRHLYNAAVWLRQGEVIATYHKRELPNYSVFDEKRYFSAGSRAVVVELKGFHFGLAICEDAWEAEPLAEAKAAGAELALIINASPFHIGKYQDRVHALQQRATQNDMPVIYLNMVGGQDELVFDGESLVIDNKGDVLLRAAAFESSIEYLDVSREKIRPRTSGATTAIGEPESIYRALVLGVRDFVRKNGFSGVVIGLSGG